MKWSVCSVECEAWSLKWKAGSVECKVESVKCGEKLWSVTR